MSESEPQSEKPNPTAPAWFQWGIFPTVMGGAVLSAVALVNGGMAPAIAVPLCQVAAVVCVAIAEHIHPYHRSWNIPRADVGVDTAHTLTITIGVGLASPIVIGAGVALGGFLSRTIGATVWPEAWPLVFQIVLALVIGEIPGYWLHRLEHEWDGLWRFHATHHSAPRLYWLNAGRFHPLDTLLTFVPSYGLLVLLGCPEFVLGLFTLVTGVHGIFQHANIQLRLGALNWFFSMAELHRWHHSKTVFEANHNYGQTVSIWDAVFGTRFLPEDRLPPRDIGIADLPDFPMTWAAQLASPFRWEKIKQGSPE
ncbi:MAG: sterol desaturase family protein [Candidatus Binatia bacterium]|nr:sterol desaturase family protein [Candidatus Binatia bacterium]